jgi:hypothetical protein
VPPAWTSSANWFCASFRAGYNARRVAGLSGRRAAA